MEACSTLGSTLLEMLDVRVTSNIESNVKVGEVILVISANVPCGQWSLGHAVEVVDGDNGFVQVVKVQVGGSVVTHSITKICPLEVNQGNQNIMTVHHGTRGE